MLSRHLSQLKNLPAWEPKAEWLNKARYEIMAEIASQTRLSQVNRLSMSERLDLFFSEFFRRLVPSMSKMIAAFLVVSMSSTVAFAAQASVPGETLWPIKRSMEQAELTITFSQVKETEVHLKHVNTRVNEIGKILADTKNSSEDISKKEKAITQAVRHLEKDAAGVDASLKLVKVESKPSEVVALVQKVTAVTKEVKSTIKEQKAVLDDKVIGEVLKDAEKASAKVNDNAVTVAVEVHDQVVAVSTMSSKELSAAVATGTMPVSAVALDEKEVQAIKNDVKAILVEQIKEASTELDTIKSKAETVDSKTLEQVKDQITTKDTVTSAEVKDVIENVSNKGKENLDKATTLVNEGALKDALDKVTETKEASSKAEVVLEKVDQLKQDNATKPADQSSTNTKPNATSTGTTTTTTPAKKIEASAINDEPWYDPEAIKEEELIPSSLNN